MCQEGWQPPGDCHCFKHAGCPTCTPVHIGAVGRDGAQLDHQRIPVKIGQDKWKRSAGLICGPASG